MTTKDEALQLSIAIMKAHPGIRARADRVRNGSWHVHIEGPDGLNVWIANAREFARVWLART